MADGRKIFRGIQTDRARRARRRWRPARSAVYVSGRPSGNDPAGGGRHRRRRGGRRLRGQGRAGEGGGRGGKGEVAAMLPADPPQSLAGLAFTGPDGRRPASASSPARRCFSICGRRGARRAGRRCRPSTGCRRSAAARVSRWWRSTSTPATTRKPKRSSKRRRSAASPTTATTRSASSTS